MNRAQVSCMWAGVLVVVLMGLYPLWVERLDIPYRLHLQRPAGYGWLFAGPKTPIHVTQTIPRYKPGDILEEKDFLSEGSATPEPELSTKTPFEIDWSRLVLELVLVSILTGAAIVTFLSGRGPSR